MLRRAGIGQFRHLKEDPIFREISLPLAPTATNQIPWEEGIAYGVGNYPYLVFDLPENRYVSGIRLKYSYWSQGGTHPYVSIYWKRGDQPDFTQDQFYKYSPTGDYENWPRATVVRKGEPERTMTVWVCDSINQIRIHPDFKPCTFKLQEVALRVPDQE